MYQVQFHGDVSRPNVGINTNTSISVYEIERSAPHPITSGHEVYNNRLNYSGVFETIEEAERALAKWFDAEGLVVWRVEGEFDEENVYCLTTTTARTHGYSGRSGYRLKK